MVGFGSLFDSLVLASLIVLIALCSFSVGFMLLAGYSIAAGSKIRHMLNCKLIVEAYLPVGFTNLCCATGSGVAAGHFAWSPGKWFLSRLLGVVVSLQCFTARRFFE